MRFTLSWLQDHLATRQDLDGLLELMLKAGLEVESVEDEAARLDGFTVAKVTDAAPHPDADRLKVCTVDTVDGTKTIVCGAPNARAGMSAIYAPLGQPIPGAGFSLDKKPRKIRGVESHGMLCSADELGLEGGDSDGIIDLDTFHEVGTPASEALGASEVTIDFEVTPNRPDWLGVQGIARDLAAAGAGRFTPKDAKPHGGGKRCPLAVETAAPDACAVFAAVMVTGVRNGPSPDWMQARLRAAGLTPRSLLVDITNYVSLDRARPLHAYDAAKLQGPVTARMAERGETLEAIDGNTYTLTPDMCVIADAEGPVGIGGVMGGQRTAVSHNTQAALFESAWFEPLGIARTGRALGIGSEARYRFERGVDPTSCEAGLHEAIALVKAHGGPDVDVSALTVSGEPPAPPASVTFLTADIARLTGLAPKQSEIRRMLRDLGMDAEDAGDAFHLVPPRWRFDIRQSADLVEEVARLIGYDALPAAPLPSTGRRPQPSPARQRVRTARRAMAALGFDEAVTWSFMDEAAAEPFGGAGPALADPVAPHLSHMRGSALPNLARAAQQALQSGAREVRLFEAGPVYRGLEPGDQSLTLAAVAHVPEGRHWRGSAPAYDAFAAREDLARLLDALGQPLDRFKIVQPAGPGFHPGQGAALMLGPKRRVAQFGALHPGVLREMGVEAALFGFEIDFGALPPAKRAAISRDPLPPETLSPVRRDLAFVVDAALPAGEVARLALAGAKGKADRADVFDVYSGEGIEDGKKSVAIEVTLLPREKITDADIQAVIDAVIANVAKGAGGTLRA